MASPQIKDLRHDARPKPDAFREGESTVLVVPRSGGLQVLRFENRFGVHGTWGEIGGLSNMKGTVDEDEHLITPLRRWLKDNVEKKKVGAVDHATFSRCTPR